MSAGPETCATCMWWFQQAAPLAKLSLRLDVDENVGTCQLSPPVALPGYAAGVFPQVHADRTCGQWEAESDDDGPDGGETVDDKVVPLRAAA